MQRRAHADVGDLYRECYGRLVGVVALAADDPGDAEECVQEAFVRLIGRWSTVGRYEDPEAWVRCVAFRLLSNRRRQARNRIRALLKLHSEHRRPTDQASDAGPMEAQSHIARALSTLTLPQRQVVVLHYLVGLPVAEIASVLSIAPGTVKSRLSRARDMLAPVLREDAPHA
jgi:RNA polymerase sigma-70 factor (ECF subfamily)